jgi:hypothetical protein
MCSCLYVAYYWYRWIVQFLYLLLCACRTRLIADFKMITCYSLNNDHIEK